MAKDHKGGKSQVTRFRAAARELETDNSEKRLNENWARSPGRSQPIRPSRKRRKLSE
jgi:hypothetical protein